MKLERIFAGLVAGALATSTLAVAAFAAETPADEAENLETGTDAVVGDSTGVGDTEAPEEWSGVALTSKGKTVIDGGKVRTNIINAWVNDPDCVIAAKEAFKGASKLEVTFTVKEFANKGTDFQAWVSFADSTWETQYWGPGNEGNKVGESEVADVTADGTFTVAVDLGMNIEAMGFIAVCTDLAAEEGDAIPTIEIDEVKINVAGADIGDTTTPVDPNGDDTSKDDDKKDDDKKDDNNGNANTGVALAVIPAALAAAGTVVTGISLKKRK